MDLVTIAIMLCIGNTAAWLAAIYVEGGDRLLLPNIILGTIGAFVPGLLIDRYLPGTGIAGSGLGAMCGAGLLIYAAHRWRRQRSG